MSKVSLVPMSERSFRTFLHTAVVQEQRGLLKGSWGTTESNRKARFYALTAAGRRELAREKQAWDRMTTIMQALLRGGA